MFHTTRWSVVLRARGPDEEARLALSELCEAYWPPLYVYARRRGAGDHEARDVVQGFFASLLERGDLARVEPERGRFRSFLRVSLRNFMAAERSGRSAEKRGGGRAPLSIDFDSAAHATLEPRDEETPERAFERAWALALLDRALARLRAEYEAAGKGEVFDALRGQLEAGADAAPLRAIGAGLGLTESAVKVAAHRLRKRYRGALRQEVAQTVGSPGEVEDELRELFGVLAAAK